MARLTKRGRRILIGSAILVTVVGVGFWSFRASAKAAKPKKLSPSKAVSKAFSQMGAGTSKYALTDFAYILAYPTCPSKLDPDNARHQGCIDKWMDLLSRVEAKKAALPPEEKKSTTGTQALSPLLQWWESLSSSQRSTVKEVIGTTAVNQLVTAARNGNATQVRARLTQVQGTFEQKSKIAQAQAYMKLKGSLGQKKLDEFTAILD